MEKLHNIVYKTTNLINGKIYVGIHRTDNLDDRYLGSGKLLHQALKKYGRENFKRDILHDVDSSELASFIEELLVDSEFLKRNNVYNIKPGGLNGNPEVLTLEHKRNISKGMIGHNVSDTCRKRLHDAHFGKKKSINHRIRLSNAKCDKKILCITTGKVYNTLAEAELDSKTCRQNIWNSIKGNRKSAGKDINGKALIWKYIEGEI